MYVSTFMLYGTGDPYPDLCSQPTVHRTAPLNVTENTLSTPTSFVSP